MNYEQIETDIVARLQPLAADGEVVKLPEKQADYVEPFNSYKITVSYKSSKFEEPFSTAETAQYEDVMIDVMIEARNLRGPGGCYPLMDAVRRLLLGYKPTDCDRMYLKEAGFVELRDNQWNYAMSFITRGVICEADPVENDPLPTLIEFENEAGETVAQAGPNATP